MKQLPFWHLTSKYPAFFDTDSKTVIEQTAKIYGAMQTLIDEQNTFNNELTKAIEEFETSTTKDINEFKTCITKIVSNYIKIVDDKLAQQDLKIKNIDTVENIKTLIDSGKLRNEPVYNEETEEMDIILKFVEGGE